MLHGGPGSGSYPGTAHLLDEADYRVILFDQRQCGRSTPHASDPATDLSTNTTEHLLTDLERLRDARKVERWVVYGHSRGALLEIDWLYRSVGVPARRVRTIPGGSAAEDRDGDLIKAYQRLVNDPDPAVYRAAAAAFYEWEWASMSADADTQPPESWLDSRFQLAPCSDRYPLLREQLLAR